MPSLAYQKAHARADGQCEVMISNGYVWNRCVGYGTDVHHALPRSRGGMVLDKARESYHLIVCCRKHHDEAHANPEASYLSGLTIDGYVVTDRYGKPHYVGTEPYLKAKYGDAEFTETPVVSRSAHHATPRPLAGPARRRPPPGVDCSVGRRSTDQWPARP